MTTAIDVLTAFVISGASALLAFALTTLVRPDEPAVRAGLRICGSGFLVLGLTLFQLVAGVDSPTSPAMVVTLAGSCLGVVLFGWGLARLAGVRVPPAAVAATGVVVLVLHGVAAQVGGWPLSHVFLASMALVSTAAALAMAPMIRRPGSMPERLLGLAMIGFAGTWWLRLALTIAYDGPLQVHHLHAPAGLSDAFAVFYGVMPMFLAVLLLAVINARLMQRLAHRAHTDELTGAQTRRALNEDGPALVAREREAGREVALLMIDLDHFKAINDRLGHLAGDDVLRQAADVVRSQLRGDAMLARYGGEEFAALVPVPDVAAARQAAERVRLAMASQRLYTGALELAVTCSVGVALVGPQDTLDAALQRADEALYRAKRGGRDRVEIALEVAA